MIDHTMKPDIDQELETIIEKYNLDRHYPAYRTSKQACDYIRKWIENLSDDEGMFLFITMDDSALWMIRSWTGRKKNVGVIWISTVGQLGNNITKLQNANKIYIVAYTRTIEILHWLWRHDLRAESVYDILENQHIYCQMEFYRFFTPLILSDELGLDELHKERNADGAALTLYEYYYQKQRLQYVTSEEDERRINEKLFFLAICMRNFLEAERILKEGRTISCNAEYKACWQDIETLFDKIKKILAQKEYNHILIYWLDGLGYENAKKLEYLQEQRKHSLHFHNAFTLTTYTLPTFKTMFFGIRQMDDLGYRMRVIDMDNSPLLQDIKEQGYDFRIISTYINRYLGLKYNRDYYGRQMWNAPCSEAFWNLTKQIIQSRQPTVYLAHALVELHSPRLSIRRSRLEAEYEWVSETSQAQFDELNGQLQFYDQMMGDNAYRIYMSDHGNNGAFVNNFHVCLQIYHAAWKNKEVKKLFCYLDFPKIIHQLMTEGKVDDTTWNREYVAVQDVDVYDPNRLKIMLKERALTTLPLITAYKGVVTSEYIYVRLKTGDEIFHKWSEGIYVPVLDFNNSQKNTALFKELRKKAGEFPEELDTDSKFEYAKNTYKIYQNVKKTIDEAVSLLNEMLIKYPDGSIVLRAGGFHTMQLCAILPEDSRKKIAGILDRNAECECKHLGYRIYLPEDKLPNNIKAVLLSSYDNLTELKSEAEKLYSDLAIIDIYQYWMDCGYDFPSNFYYGLESDRDIEFLKE